MSATRRFKPSSERALMSPFQEKGYPGESRTRHSMKTLWQQSLGSLLQVWETSKKPNLSDKSLQWGNMFMIILSSSTASLWRYFKNCKCLSWISWGLSLSTSTHLSIVWVGVGCSVGWSSVEGVVVVVVAVEGRIDGGIVCEPSLLITRPSPWPDCFDSEQRSPTTGNTKLLA